MPIHNLGKKHFTEEQKTAINTALTHLFELTNELAINLTPKERSRYGKVGEKGKLLIDKIRSLKESQPELTSPEIDWDEFEKDYQDRQFSSSVLSKIESLQMRMLSIKILHDYDNNKDALLDYQHAKHKNRFSNQTGYANKIESLKNFFPKTGKTKKKEIQ
jgi:hypothetical protein